MILRLIAFVSNRWTRLVLVTLLLLGIQTTLLNDMRPFGVMIQTMLLLVAAVGVVYGSEVGAIAGFVVGLMYDGVLATPLGLSGLVLGVTGALAGTLLYFLREPTWWSRVLAVGVVSVAGELLFPLFQALIGFEGWLQPRAIRVAFVVGLFNLLLAPLAIGLSRWTLRENSGN
jgi:rod shape-determining protein MreD